VFNTQISLFISKAQLRVWIWLSCILCPGIPGIEFRANSLKSRLFINNINFIKAVPYLQLLRIPGMINEIISILKNGKRN